MDGWMDDFMDDYHCIKLGDKVTILLRSVFHQ